MSAQRHIIPFGGLRPTPHRVHPIIDYALAATGRPRAHGVDIALRAAWEAGVVLTGGSAGSLAWFECGTTDSYSLDRLEPLHDGLGFLPGSHCPHYDGEVQRRPLYQRLVAEGLAAGIAMDNDAAVHYVGTEIAEVVSASEDSTAYRVEPDGKGGITETALEARLLG